MGKIKDITGQKFGMLTALQNTGKKDNSRNFIWECECECGNTCEVSGNNLRTGHTKSCGCLRKTACKEVGKRSYYIDEVGNKYGRLTVKEAHHSEHGIIYWLCECECGNFIIVAGNHLRGGHTQSCGCIKSVGEYRINQLLSQNNISYQTQYAVLIDDSYLRFDFALLDKNNQVVKFIEYDGEFHYPGFKNPWEDYESVHFRDLLKNEYCKINNIPLVRIPYWERDNLTLDLIVSDKYLI